MLLIFITNLSFICLDNIYFKLLSKKIRLNLRMQQHFNLNFKRFERLISV